MHCDMESQTSSLVIDLQEFDRLDEFETAVLEQLPTIGGSSTFGCELSFAQSDTGQLLQNPIWDTLRDCNQFQVIVRQCCSRAEHKRKMKWNAKAIQVPAIRSGKVIPHAFTHSSSIRHVRVDAGVRTIGEAAWQHCSRLLIVHLPNSLVCLKDGVFRRCYVLHTVTAPECRDFGCWVFEECYALTRIGDPDSNNNQLAPQARLRTRAFEKCRSLRAINLEKTEYNPRDPNRVIPEGCFTETGLETLDLPADFSWIGPAAFEHCVKLRSVDISRTDISEIIGGTFANCSQLQHLKLAKSLRRIEREAFVKCTSLEEIHTPPDLLHINRRAFAGCIQLNKLVRIGKKRTWRGTYAEHNAFELCTKLALPAWIRFLPKPDAAKEEWEDYMRSSADLT